MACPQVCLHWRRCRRPFNYAGRCTRLTPQARCSRHGNRQLRPPLSNAPGPATCPGSSPRRLVAAPLSCVGTDMAAATAFFSSSVLRPGLAPPRRWRALSRLAPRTAYSTSSSPRRAARYAAPVGASSSSLPLPSPLPPPPARCGGEPSRERRAGRPPRAPRRLTVALEARERAAGRAGANRLRRGQGRAVPGPARPGPAPAPGRLVSLVGRLRGGCPWTPAELKFSAGEWGSAGSVPAGRGTGREGGKVGGRAGCGTGAVGPVGI